MLTRLNEFLLAQPIVMLFLVLGLGELVGNISVFGISLGAVGGVLLVGLVFGHFGHTLAPVAQSFGFVLFIFCVGIQAGPRYWRGLCADLPVRPDRSDPCSAPDAKDVGHRSAGSRR